jgi:chromosomal replication initiation ATPase DnaA
MTTEELLIHDIAKTVANVISNDYYLIKKRKSLDKINSDAEAKMMAESFLIERCIDEVCTYFGVSIHDLISDRRDIPFGKNYTLSQMRGIVYKLCLDIPYYLIPVTTVANRFGKHHSTVLSGRNAVSNDCIRNADFKKDYDTIFNSVVDYMKNQNEVTLKLKA